MRLQLSEIAAVLGQDPPQRDLTIGDVVTDSRRAQYGCLFAALPGRQVDGHDFASSAVELGAVALLVQRPVDLAVPQLVVPSVLRALGQIARRWRERVDPIVTGITGSNGKTTVKEMLAGILRQQGEVLATQGNYNNELGLPLTLFRLTERHRYAVLEMGASKAGDIAYLAGVARPDIGLITNVGPAHLEGFGSVEGVARAKGEMYAALPADGCAVLNADEPWCDAWRQMSSAGRCLTFGTQRSADVRFTLKAGQARFATPAGQLTVQLTLPGSHNAANAAAAVAAALAMDVPIDTIRAGLESVEPVPGRLNLIRTAAGWTVIDDTYNANPASLYSALQVLSGMQGKAWLVLGDMKELGEGSRKLHQEVGDAARSLGVKRIYAVGDMSEATVDAFGHGGRHFASQAVMIEALLADLRPGINCLVKGSRSMGMERVVQAITRPSGIREAC